MKGSTNQSKQWYYSRDLSEPNDPIFIHTFPVVKYNGRVTMYCEFVWIKNESRIKVNVYDNNNGCQYVPFYVWDCGDYRPLILKINKEIIKELDKMWIIDIDNYNG